jgi:hypothetical protein
LVFLILIADDSFLFALVGRLPRGHCCYGCVQRGGGCAKKITGDDAGDGRASSAEPNAPNLIRSNEPGPTDPSIADRAATTDPPIGGCRHKHPSFVPKRKRALPSSDQVMFQIELPAYREPHSSLDLVTVEIIFGRLFEAFQRISQAAGTGASVGADTPPQKKMRQPPLKKILVLR